MLTPNHLLIGQIGGDVAQESVNNTAFNPRKRWRRVQELIRLTWNRWMKEYLTTLGSRSKWFTEENNVKERDMVWLIDQGAAR